jgi:hypothetical protein
MGDDKPYPQAGVKLVSKQAEADRD